MGEVITETGHCRGCHQNTCRTWSIGDGVIRNYCKNGECFYIWDNIKRAGIPIVRLVRA